MPISSQSNFSSTANYHKYSNCLNISLSLCLQNLFQWQYNWQTKIIEIEINVSTLSTMLASLRVIIYYIYLSTGSSHGLVDKQARLVIKFRVRFPQKSLVVLGRKSSLKIFLYYAKNPALLPALWGFSQHPNKGKKSNIGFSPGNKADVTSVCLYVLQYVFWRDFNNK